MISKSLKKIAFTGVLAAAASATFANPLAPLTDPLSALLGGFGGGEMPSLPTPDLGGGLPGLDALPMPGDGAEMPGLDSLEAIPVLGSVLLGLAEGGFPPSFDGGLPMPGAGDSPLNVDITLTLMGHQVLPPSLPSM